MSNYKVHIPYINTHGTLINKGVYSSSEIDLAEARNKSVVTLVDATVDTKTTSVIDELPTITFNAEDNSYNINSDSVQEIKLKANEEIYKLNTKIKINTVTLEELKELKYVGKATAEKIIKAREKGRLVSYTQLDKIAPLKGKKWEDVIVIDFEELFNITLENSVNINDTN